MAKKPTNSSANNGDVNVDGNGRAAAASASTAAQSTAVYVRDDELGWRPAELLHAGDDDGCCCDADAHENMVSVRLLAPPSSSETAASAAHVGVIRRVDLSEYENNSLPLREGDGDGDDPSSPLPPPMEDMCNLPHPNEASILYNLRGRHVRREPYTRAGVVVAAVNPFVWMNHLYTTDVRRRYATDLVWRPPRPRAAGAADGKKKKERRGGDADADRATEPEMAGQQPVPPHVYEASALAYRGLLVDGTDQSILVSGETGAGKTETVKILMVHLATMESTRCPGALEGEEDKEETADGDVGGDDSVPKDRRRLFGGGGTRARSGLLTRAVSFTRTSTSTSTPTGRRAGTGGLSSFRSLRNLLPSSSPPLRRGRSGGSYDDMKLLRDAATTTTTSTIPEEEESSPPPRSDPSWSPAAVGGGGGEGSHDDRHHHHHEVVRRVLDANPILEAFGNAGTRRNDNSSRFSRYTRLQFHAEGTVAAGTRRCILAGSVCDTYLLEKSRVVRRPEGERTFHVFDAFLRGATEEERTRVWGEGLSGGGLDRSPFRYLADGCGGGDGHGDDREASPANNGGTATTSHANDDADRWEEVVNALEDVGIRDEKFVTLFRAICVVLQLGNVVLAPKDPDDDDDEHGPCSVPRSSQKELDKLASLLGVPAAELEEALTSKTVTVPTPRSAAAARRRGSGGGGTSSGGEGGDEEVLRVPLTAGDATDGRDALAKEVYSMAFDWLVRAINDATSAEGNYDRRGEMEVAPPEEEGGRRRDGGAGGGKFAVVGLLDIFGFETFDVNGFEQLCINHANERLQQRFVRDVFVSVNAECLAEGIDLCDVNFDDNDDVLGLVEGRMGLIDLLNEECIRPRGYDAGFVNKLYTANRVAKHASGGSSSSPLFRKRGFRSVEFGVRHYAGAVVYNATHFVAKNTDVLPRGLISCTLKSTNDLIRTELSSRVMRLEKDAKKGSLVATTVWTKFRRQLVGLMDDIGNTRTRYVRCIVPNRLKEPGVMDMNFTLRQLRCAGIVNAITLSRSFFPNKMLLTTTVDRFGFLARTGHNRKHLHIAHRDQGSGQSGKNTMLKNETDCLLRALLAGWEDPTAGNKRTAKSASPFVCGKTRVYFRAGALEFLEAERLQAFDAVATVIQCRYRQSAAIAQRRQLMIERAASSAEVGKPRRRKGTISRLRKKILIVSFMARKSGRRQQGTVGDNPKQLLRSQ